MLLTALALIAQTPTLAEDTFEAAITCAQAATIADAGKKTQIRLTSQFIFYTMHAARANAGGKPFLQRLQELSDAKPAAELADQAVARSLIPACEKRFPRPLAAPRLPADPFQRDLMCFGTLSLLQGAAQALKEDKGETVPLARIEAALDPLLGKLTDASLAARGISGEAEFTELLGNQIIATIPLGEPITIANACGVQDL